MTCRSIFGKGVAWRPTFVRALTITKIWQYDLSSVKVWHSDPPSLDYSYNEDMTWRSIFDGGVAWWPTFIRALTIMKIWQCWFVIPSPFCFDDFYNWLENIVHFYSMWKLLLRFQKLLFTVLPLINILNKSNF